MKQPLRTISLLSLCLLSLSCTKDRTIEESSFVKSLTPGKYLLDAKEGWWNWCMAPIYDEEGKLHIFNSSIPNDGNWASDSIINHYVADSVEGPYEFVETTFSSDSHTYHNVQVSKVDETYVMVYLWKRSSAPQLRQEVGIATATSLYGPWTESPYNPILRS